MAAEKKTQGPKTETVTSKALKAKFKKRCKALGVSQSQRLRDLMQQDVKK